jgi:tetratricopeptide (TPR) repeat protein
MTYQEERLKRQQVKQAIALAMGGRWQDAVGANKAMIEAFPDDVDAHNRLGRAHIELGEYQAAKEAYGRALGLDPANIIAQKNLHRLAHLGEVPVGVAVGTKHVEPQHFIEEIGKAEVVTLNILAPPAVLVRMVAGAEVNLRIDGVNLVVENGLGEYLGQVEPRHAQRLIKLMGGGNRYQGAIVSSSEARLTVIIRETYQHPSQAGQLSFPPRGPEKLQPIVGGRVLEAEGEDEEGMLEEATGMFDEGSEEE